MLWVTWPPEKSNSRRGRGRPRRRRQRILRERRSPSVVNSRKELGHAGSEGPGEGAAADVLRRDQHGGSREFGGAALQPIRCQKDHIGVEEQGVAPEGASHQLLQGFRLGATANQHLGPVIAGDGGGGIAGVVIQNTDVHTGRPGGAPQGVQAVGQEKGAVPTGDTNEEIGVGHGPGLAGVGKRARRLSSRTGRLLSMRLR